MNVGGRLVEFQLRYSIRYHHPIDLNFWIRDRTQLPFVFIVWISTLAEGNGQDPKTIDTAAYACLGIGTVPCLGKELFALTRAANYAHAYFHINLSR